jgi:2-polyprenyl-6-methoxyphenol hydroxylase-like FAD-dependent oxidoreductase
MKPTNHDVLISGASIAGPTLAYWLRRSGFAPTVVEQTPALRAGLGGHAVDLFGPAVDVAEWMGILPQVLAARTRTDQVTIEHPGRSPVQVDLSRLVAGISARHVEIMRGELTSILHQATRDDIEYRFGDSIRTLDQDDDGVEVTFEHGTPRRFGLVVGADGLHSGVRALAFGEESRFVRHLGAYVSSYSIPNHLDLDGWELLYSVPGKTAGMYPTRQGTTATAVFFFTSPPLAYDRHDPGQQKQLLARAFAGEAWEVPRLLEAMWEAPDFYFDTVSQVRMDRWSSGRVALVGDAAYGPSPMAGVGTSLALVGAYVLAGELAAAGGDHRTAFASYERELRDYVGKGHKLAKGNAAGLVPRTRSQIWLRNQFIRALPYMPWKGVVAGGVQKAANAIALRDYEERSEDQRARHPERA